MRQEPSRLIPTVLFGAAYYAEYGHLDRIESDLDLMAGAGFTVIRVGESVWSTWEPENGRYELEWLQPVLDGARERGISVLLGTPTYAVPPWLARQYPEIAAERSTGTRIGWGARQEVDFTHPGFRFHAERVIRAVVGRYHAHPAVIGFQVDNEPGLELFHNRGVFERFVDHLRNTYRTIDRLNEDWGLVYWSHRLSTWSDLWTPDGNAQPQYDVAWREFQGLQTAEFIAWQTSIVNEYAGPEQFITTCIAYDRPAMNDERVSRALDITSGNAYYGMQDGLELPATTRATQKWKTYGVWALNLTADRMYGSRQAPFLVTETNAASIGAPWHNLPAYDGQWRQAAWLLAVRGARMIEYWHWHTLPWGTETYWGGVLPHSGTPNRVYRELGRIGSEFKQAGELIAGLTPDADIAMVYDVPSKWLMEKYPPLAEPNGAPIARSYHEIFDAFYKGAFDAGLQTRVVHARQLLEGAPGRPAPTPAELASMHPVLVAAGTYLADNALLQLMVEYARAGGHLVVGPRTGYADELGRARTVLAPAIIADAARVHYDEYSNIDDAIPVTVDERSPLRAATHGAHAERWIDGLLPDGAEVLAGYDHRHFGRWAAVTSQVHGKGRITLVGTVPDSNFAATLMRWVRPGRTTWADLPETVTVNSATADDGRRVHVVHNWSWERAQVKSPTELSDVLADTKYLTHDTIALGAWDVVVLVE